MAEAAPAPGFGGPHVLLLGAGASLATCPDGDRFGQPLPLLCDLVGIVGLADLLESAGVRNEVEDFEAVYSELVTGGRHTDVLEEIEHRIRTYFSGIRIPDRPTTYDHLLLSLRAKDIVGTFNWDPLLWQAAVRLAQRRIPIPDIVFLHGNVAVGTCFAHEPPTLGTLGQSCSRCGEPLSEVPLLYPVAEKDYRRERTIRLAWDRMQEAVGKAFLFTIYGYSAPVTDQSARELLIDAWGDPELRNFEEVEIINIIDHDTLYEQWSPIILREHYRTCNCFYDSLAAVHPRRSCESWWNAVGMCAPDSERPIPKDADWVELMDWVAPLVEAERDAGRPPNG